MKRTICLMLICVMAFSMAACGSGTGNEKASDSSDGTASSGAASQAVSDSAASGTQSSDSETADAVTSATAENPEWFWREYAWQQNVSESLLTFGGSTLYINKEASVLSSGVSFPDSISFSDNLCYVQIGDTEYVLELSTPKTDSLFLLAVTEYGKDNADYVLTVTEADGIFTCQLVNSKDTTLYAIYEGSNSAAGQNSTELSADSCTEVQVTLENWQDYFTFREVPEVSPILNVFNEVTGTSFDLTLYLVLKDDYLIDASRSEAAVEYSGNDNAVLLTFDPDTGDYEIGETVGRGYFLVGTGDENGYTEGNTSSFSYLDDIGFCARITCNPVGMEAEMMENEQGQTILSDYASNVEITRFEGIIYISKK